MLLWHYFEQKNVCDMFLCSKNSYLYTMNNPLRRLGNIPVTVSALESLFPHIKRGNQKVRLLERDKQIIRLKRGLYVCNPEITGKILSALRYYGLIPETVYTKQSMTLKHSRDFDTPLGRFEYTNISKEAFSVGLTSMKKEDYAFVMATPEKALCDLIANSPKVNLRYLKDAEIYLEEDIRMELEEFKQMDAEICEEYIKVGKKAESIRTLLKLMRK